MLKFIVEKKAIERATALLNQVANMKSAGATPSESSGLQLTPTTLTLSNMNEANGVRIEDIPITVVEGEVGQYLDRQYMINTKKFDSVVRGGGPTVHICIGDAQISVGENKRKYELSVFSIGRQDPPELRLFGYQVELKRFLRHMEDVNYISDNAQNIAALSGALFSGKNLMASDRISAIFIKDGELLGQQELPDVMISTDLFSSCLPKLDATALCYPGFTADGRRLVLQIGNIVLYKTVLVEAFPKDQLLKHMAIIEQAATGDPTTVKAVINLEEYMLKLKELCSIVEAEDYHLSYHREGCIKISNRNTKSGAEGVAIVDAQVTMPEGFAGEVIEAKFGYTHLELLGKLFKGQEALALFSALNTKNNQMSIKYLSVHTPEKAYFAIPKV